MRVKMQPDGVPAEGAALSRHCPGDRLDGMNRIVNRASNPWRARFRAHGWSGTRLQKVRPSVRVSRSSSDSRTGVDCTRARACPPASTNTSCLMDRALTCFPLGVKPHNTHSQARATRIRGHEPASTRVRAHGSRRPRVPDPRSGHGAPSDGHGDDTGHTRKAPRSSRASPPETPPPPPLPLPPCHHSARHPPAPPRSLAGGYGSDTGHMRTAPRAPTPPGPPHRPPARKSLFSP